VALSASQCACHHTKGRLASHTCDKDQLKEMLSTYPQREEHNVPSEKNNTNVIYYYYYSFTAV
jgi:hypothetical protein